MFRCFGSGAVQRCCPGTGPHAEGCSCKNVLVFFMNQSEVCEVHEIERPPAPEKGLEG